MTMTSGPLLTLEPLIEAVREGVEGAGWELSGLQKTTSHEFAGRWEGESTRSAYLFFHSAGHPDTVSIEGFLDETSRGLQGSLTLVLDGRPLRDLGDPTEALRRLGSTVVEEMTADDAVSVSLRARLGQPGGDPGAADVEIRFRLRVPAAAIRRGTGEVAALSGRAVASFEAMAADEQVRRFLPGG